MEESAESNHSGEPREWSAIRSTFLCGERKATELTEVHSCTLGSCVAHARSHKLHVQYRSDTRYKTRVIYTRLHEEANTLGGKYMFICVYTRRQTHLPLYLASDLYCICHLVWHTTLMTVQLRNLLSLGSRVFICISKEWCCNKELRGVGNFEFEPVIRKFKIF